MPSSADYKVSASKSVLLIGDSGTHKTWLAGHFPKPQIFDFDKGLEILRDVTFDFDTFKDAPYLSTVTNPANGIYPWGTAWPAFTKRLNEIGALAEKGELPYETLVFDSLTTLSNICMNYVMKEKSHYPPKGPEIQHWGAQMSLMETVIDQITAWPYLYKVFTAHVQRDTNTLTMQVEKLPLVTGKLAGKVSIYFDEVYFTDSTKDKEGKQSFFLRTMTEATHRQAKSRSGVPDNTAAEFTELVKHYAPTAK